MRLNLPVRQREFAIPAGATLMSTTNAGGRIVYANAAFVHASGFTRAELIGQPHNIVRHPDNAALVEESAAAAGSLNQQAKRLADAVNVYRVVS